MNAEDDASRKPPSRLTHSLAHSLASDPSDSKREVIRDQPEVGGALQWAEAIHEAIGNSTARLIWRWSLGRTSEMMLKELTQTIGSAVRESSSVASLIRKLPPFVLTRADIRLLLTE